MNFAHLRSLLAIRKTGSLSGAASVVNLSHSALSVQMKHLESEIGAPLFVKGKRPTCLTPLGHEVAEEACEILAKIDHIKQLSNQDGDRGNVRLGFVPTTLDTILPVTLRFLRERFPNLEVSAISGLSANLATQIEEGELDFAFLSAPVVRNPQIALHEIGREKLFLISSTVNESAKDIESLLDQSPYIAFNRETWLGGQITQFLDGRGLNVPPKFELDSIDAIERLVQQGYGVSIVPQRLLAPDLADTLKCTSLGKNGPSRRLALASPIHCRRQKLRQDLSEIAHFGHGPEFASG